MLVSMYSHMYLWFLDNTIIAWIKDNYHEQGNIIIIHLLLPLGHISNSKMHFTYLGLPLGTTEPTMTDLLPLVDWVERRLSSTCSLLCHASRITLVNSVDTSMINFAMCTLQLNAGFMQYFDKVTRRFVWTKKNEQGESCNSLVAWQRVCCTKAHGGLGVINIKV